MIRLFLILSFLSVFEISLSQNKDTTIEIIGNVIDGYSNQLFSSKAVLGARGGLTSYVGSLDTNLNINYFYARYKNFSEIGFNINNEIIGINGDDLKLYKKLQKDKYSAISINSLNQNGFLESFFYPKGIVFTPWRNTRDSLNNLVLQNFKHEDSIIYNFPIQNSQNKNFCYLCNNLKNGLTAYILTPKDSAGLYEFGFFDSTFKKLDSFSFQHPNTIPSKASQYKIQKIKLIGNKLIIAGVSQINFGVVKAIPYKFSINLLTKQIESIWYNQAINLESEYRAFFPEAYIDDWGNVFYYGAAEINNGLSWKNLFGILQMVDSNNLLMVDTLYQFNSESDNKTDFIYHLGGGHVILGGHYNYNTGINPAVWYKKFNIKDWNLPILSVKEQNIKTDKFSIFPNPFNSLLSIKGNLIEIQSINIFDLNGRLVQNEPIKKELNLSVLEKGAYFIEIKSNGGVIERHKIIKQE